jgi:cell wall-associated NlpC family hydrolase
MTYNQIENTFAELKQSSRVSLVLVMVGALMLLGSVWYSITRLRPLQLEVSSAEQRLREITSDLATKQERLTQIEKTVTSLQKDQDKLLDFMVQVADNKQVRLLDPDVDWDSVKRDLAQLPAGDRKQALLIAILMAWKDVPFTLGGTAANSGFDSPRFINFVLSKVGVEVKAAPGQRLSDALMQQFQKTDKPRPGDLVFYRGLVGSFGLIYLSDGKDGSNPAGIGTLQGIAPLQIMSLRNVNTPYFPLIGYFHVTYPDEQTN